MVAYNAIIEYIDEMVKVSYTLTSGLKFEPSCVHLICSNIFIVKSFLISYSRIYMFMLDFGLEHTKARELVNLRTCQEIIVFP